MVAEYGAEGTVDLAGNVGRAFLWRLKAFVYCVAFHGVHGRVSTLVSEPFSSPHACVHASSHLCKQRHTYAHVLAVDERTSASPPWVGGISIDIERKEREEEKMREQDERVGEEIAVD